MLNFDRIPYLIVYKVFLKYIHRYIGVDFYSLMIPLPLTHIEYFSYDIIKEC